MKRGVKKTSKITGSIRIVGGRWRGRKLPVLDVQGLRPTTDRNKETLFNWLMHDTRDALCLDVFAGSGGLGFEALSRFAKSVTFIELDKKAVQKIKENAKLLDTASEEISVFQGHAEQVLSGLNQPFDLIFLDPPFNKGMLPSVIRLVDKQNLLADHGLIYIECEGQNGNYPVPDSWRMLKERVSTQVISRLYRKSNSVGFDSD